jgi:4-hydroxyphenylpyruvate dioxygenase
VDVPAPYGLRRSRAVSTPDGGVRVALSIAPAPTAENGTAQHVAFVTKDVVAMARRLKERGHLLTIPGNYYDDLDARFDFPRGVLDTYRELSILYDREGDAEFLHCYTRTVGRVFFEVVQRAPGYRGFGEQSAAVRLAAQGAHDNSFRNDQ